MNLTIITINYNGSNSTIKLLKSLQEQTTRDFQIIVVDNASKEIDFGNLLQTTEATKGIFAKMPFVIRNDQNLGFSGGNNVGIKKALEMGSDWVLLLNNDTWVEPDFVAQVRAVLESKAGIVGLPLDEKGKIAYCGKIKWLKPTLEHSYQETRDKRQNRKYAIGGGMLISKDVFEKIGFLDEKYFLYFEDADFCIRARKAKIQISIADNVMVHHNISSTTKKLGAPLLLRYHYRNALYFNWKNGPRYIKLLVWPWSFWIILKQTSKIMIYHNREQSIAILRGAFDFYRNKMGKV